MERYHKQQQQTSSNQRNNRTAGGPDRLFFSETKGFEQQAACISWKKCIVKKLTPRNRK